MSANPEYRRCVGIMLINAAGRVFVGNRRGMAQAWQMPQGGIDTDEAPADAVMRELHEEVGTNRARILAESGTWYDYDFPRGVGGKAWGGRYRGQTQRWFLLSFTGRDADIRLDRHHDIEFDDWRWVALDELLDLIVPFKRDVYARVVDEFRPAVVAHAAAGDDRND